MAPTSKNLGLLTTAGLIALMAAGCSSAPTAPDVHASAASLAGPGSGAGEAPGEPGVGVVIAYL